MLSKSKLPICCAVIGISSGFTLMKLNVAHNNDVTKLSLLIVGAALCVLAPLGALVWTLKQQGRHRIPFPELLAILITIIGMMNPALHSSARWSVGGILFYTGLTSLMLLTLVRWQVRRKQNRAFQVAESGILVMEDLSR